MFEKVITNRIIKLITFLVRYHEKCWFLKLMLMKQPPSFHSYTQHHVFQIKYNIDNKKINGIKRLDHCNCDKYYTVQTYWGINISTSQIIEHTLYQVLILHVCHRCTDVQYFIFTGCTLKLFIFRPYELSSFYS